MMILASSLSKTLSYELVRMLLLSSEHVHTQNNILVNVLFMNNALNTKRRTADLC